MILKTLNYRRFRDNGAEVLFSTRTCGIFQPDSTSLSVLEYLDGTPPSTREGVIEALSEEFDAAVIGNAIDELERAGFVSTSAEEEEGGESPSPGERAPLPRVTHLVMNVSHSCNLSCSYCYADGGSYKGKKELMKADTALELVDFLLDNAEEEKVMITFFGGEPLMNFDVVRTAIEYGEKKAKEVGKKIGFSLTTNGTLLSDDIIDYSLQHNIKLAISIDGDKEGHDSHRKFIDGKGSYDTVTSRLPRLVKEGGFPARATLTKNNMDVVAVVDHLLSLGFRQVGVAPVDSVDEDFSLDESEMERLLEGFKTLGRRFRDHALEGRAYGFTNIVNLMKLLHQGDTKPLPCGAGIKLMGVSPEGNFYMCHRFSGNDKCKVGSLHDGIDDARRGELLESLLIESKPGCRSCWAKHLCGGGCYYLADLHNGDLRKPHSATCKFLLQWYEFGIDIYLDLMRQVPSFLDACAGEDLSC